MKAFHCAAAGLFLLLSAQQGIGFQLRDSPRGLSLELFKTTAWNMAQAWSNL